MQTICNSKTVIGTMFEFLVAVSEFHSYRDIEEPYKDDL